MSTTAPEAAPETPPPAAPAPAGFARLASAIWFDPAAVGQAVAERVPWAAVSVAALVIIAVLTGAGWLCREQIVTDTIEMMRANPDMPAEQLEMAERFMTSKAGEVLMVAQNVIGPLVGFALIGLGLYVGQLVMGGRARFGQVFAVTVFACLISFAAGWILRAILVQAKGSFMAVSTGLGALVDAPMNDPLRSVLDLVDPLSIWAVIAAGIALAAPAQLSRGASIGVSVVVYVLLGGLGTVMRIFGSGG